jgi:hypothetical protein
VVARAKVQRPAQSGMTTREIGADLGISAASVCRMLNAYTGLSSPVAPSSPQG